MFRDITIKRAIIIFMMFTVLNLFLGCNDSKDITSPESSNEIVEYERSPSTYDRTIENFISVGEKPLFPKIGK